MLPQKASRLPWPWWLWSLITQNYSSFSFLHISCRVPNFIPHSITELPALNSMYWPLQVAFKNRSKSVIECLIVFFMLQFYGSSLIWASERCHYVNSGTSTVTLWSNGSETDLLHSPAPYKQDPAIQISRILDLQHSSFLLHFLLNLAAIFH